MKDVKRQKKRDLTLELDAVKIRPILVDYVRRIINVTFILVKTGKKFTT